MTERTVPSAANVLVTLVGVTWRRLFRGRALWVSVFIALLPVVLAALMEGRRGSITALLVVQFLVMALLPPMFVASALGEEIEDRTTTYLWSRPIARWTLVVSKVIALAPVAMVLVVGGGYLSLHIANASGIVDMAIALAAGTLAISAMSAGLATLVPRHGMALSIVYLVIFDLVLGNLPASIQNVAITRHVRALGIEGADKLQPALAMAIIASVWLAIGLWRVRRLES